MVDLSWDESDRVGLSSSGRFEYLRMYVAA